QPGRAGDHRRSRSGIRECRGECNSGRASSAGRARRVIHSALILLFLAATGGPLAAQSATGRWSLIIHGPTGTEFGDLRIDSTGGRLLLETHDSAWADLKDFRQHGDSLAWRIEAPELEFTGRFTAGRIEGVVHETDGFRSGFQATPIQAGIDRWPVRPRITVRQLVLGSDATAAVFPGGWAGRMVPRATLVAEHAALARDAGLPPADLATIVWRAQDVVLGFNEAGRNAVLKQFERIAASPAADAEFEG